MTLSPHLSEKSVREAIGRWLAEDVGRGDITAAATVPEDARLRAALVAREAVTVAGIDLALMVFAAVDPRIAARKHVDDGARTAAMTALAVLEGSARSILTAERTALNILQHLSGIATLTARYVDAIRGTGAVLLDTRKTIPGLRDLEKYAVTCGGGRNHRMRLDDGILIKDNHIAAAGGIGAAVTLARKAGHDEIEVECDTLADVAAALEAGARHILLDNMDPGRQRQAVALAREKYPGVVRFEASGGVTLDTIRATAETGVDFISVGRLTQSAPAVDIGLDTI